MRDVKAEKAAHALTDAEYITGRKYDTSLHATPAHCGRIMAVREFGPDEEAFASASP